MRSRVLLFALAFLISSALLPIARAQYLYFDSNGDGVHTGADVLSATGYTTADVWLDTLHDRDGSPATCDAAEGDLSIINSYAVNLRAAGGTVEYSGFVNRVVSFSMNCITASEGFRSNGTEASVCRATAMPARYAYPLRLFTLTIRVASGTPSITVVPTCSLSYNSTSFGTNCLGLDFDNTYKLGSDWHDADGLPSGAGQPNRPPVLQAVADMAVTTGTTSTQVVTASDPDFNAIAIVLASGPDYLHLIPLLSDDGSASAQIVAAPLTKDVGTASASVRVSDGVATDERTFQVTVTPGPNHVPLLRAPARLIAVAGTVTAAALEASDPDGDKPGFLKVSGPDFAEVRTLASRDGGAAGRLLLTPGACDLGDAAVVVAVTDGTVSRSQSIQVHVIASQGAPADSAIEVPASNAYGVAVGDVNGDGRADAVLGDFGNLGLRVAVGTDAGFALSSPVAVGSNPLSVTSGDFNEDGLTDAAGANYTDGTVTVLLASGGGSLAGRVDYPLLPGVDGIACADLDGDGHLDLVVTNDNSAFVLPGHGDGTFGSARTFPINAPGVFACIAIGDFDLDGRLDIAAGRTLLHNLGGGAFERWGEMDLPFPSGSVAADWTGDGLPDLALVDWGGIGAPPSMRLYRGAGDGTFQQVATGSGVNPQGIITADMDGDGDLDLAAGDWGLGVIRVWYLQGGAIVRQEDWPHASPNALATLDANRDGYPDVAYTDYGGLQVRLNRNGAAATMPQARAFLRGGHRAVAISPSSGTLSIFLEPLADSYRNDQLRPASVRLTSTGTGSVESIDAVADKAFVVGDGDHNGVSDVAVEFAAEGLARLFQNVTRLTTVHATLRGLLLDGRALCAPVDLDVVGGGGPPLVARIAPNPLNPQGTISFTTTRTGPLRVRLYDMMGRLVKTLCDSRQAAPGLHRFTFDGTTDGGSRLASGAYFFKIEALEGTRTGRLVLLR